MEKEYEIPKSRVTKETKIAAGIVAIAATGLTIYLWHHPVSMVDLVISALTPFVAYTRITTAAARDNEAERQYKLTLTPHGIRYLWPGNESLLLFSDVVSVTVTGTRHAPKSIMFKMKNGVLHEISRYESMKEILLHTESKIPFQLFSYNY